MADRLNSMRVLEQHNIDYVVREFPDSIHSADGVADHFGVPHEVVYKTLVVLQSNNKPALVLMGAGRDLNLKKLAKAIGQKKVQMAGHSEAEKLTGLLTGGISPLALMHKNFPVFIDQTALGHDRILLSAGKRGVNLEVPLADLMKLIKAKAVEAS